jgi:hypothetical protein
MGVFGVGDADSVIWARVYNGLKVNINRGSRMSLIARIIVSDRFNCGF